MLRRRRRLSAAGHWAARKDAYADDERRSGPVDGGSTADDAALYKVQVCLPFVRAVTFASKLLQF